MTNQTDLTTYYLGLKLKNPVIVASCGLTNSADKISELASNGAGAVVLKSLFEEQIMMDVAQTILVQNETNYPEGVDYISRYTKEHSIEEYLQLIRDTKSSTDIPVIASINCISDNEWVSFTSRIEEAGADALELNISIFPSNPTSSSSQNEQIYFDVIDKVSKVTDLPISVKISLYSAGLSQLVHKLDWSGQVKGIVMFNRFYNPDIDLNELKIISSNVLSSPADLYTTLRWVALLSGSLSSDLSATTGIHDASGVIKQLLAGATTVQVASALYQHGASHLTGIINGLKCWMSEKHFHKIDDFRGKLSQHSLKHPAGFERIQFMRYFGSKLN